MYDTIAVGSAFGKSHPALEVRKHPASKVHVTYLLEKTWDQPVEICLQHARIWIMLCVLHLAGIEVGLLEDMLVEVKQLPACRARGTCIKAACG